MPENAAPSPAIAPDALQPALDLQRTLLRRGALLVALLLLGLGLWSGQALGRAERAALPATARLVAQLLHQDLARQLSAFERDLEQVPVRLEVLADLERRLPLCVRLRAIDEREIGAHCGPDTPVAAPARWLGRQLAALESADRPDRVRLPLLLPAGIKAGTIEVGVHWDQVGLAWAERLLLLLGLGLLLGAAGLALSWPVGRALRPTRQILAALARLEAGEREVRLPVPPLRELRELTLCFNRLAQRWTELLARQQQLAGRLLHTREEERRHLARELHDEMAQSLSALRAETAVIGALAARTGTPALQQAAGRIATLCAQLQEALQGVLQALRPTMLDRFGLGAALEALVAQPRRREVDGALPACTLHLPARGLEALPADMAVHVYRIVQEGLTNAVRHGEARTVQVEMQVEMQAQMRLDRTIDPQAALVIDIADDGRGPGPDGPVPGHGLLGLHERVQALGGTLALDRPEAGGLRLRVRLPIRPPVATEDRT